MRKANVKDMFAMCRFIDSLDLKEEFFKIQLKNDDIERIGFDIIFSILQKCSSKEAEQGFYKVLSEPFELSIEEVSMLEIEELFKNISECINFKTLVNFYKRVGK